MQCERGTLPDETHSMCREVPEEFLRPESGWAIGAMSFSATGMLVGISCTRLIFRIINLLKLKDLKFYIYISIVSQIAIIILYILCHSCLYI